MADNNEKIEFRSEFRKAYLLNKYVLITPGRAKRPRDIKEQTILSRNADCPFCPAQIKSEKLLDYIGEKNDWQVASIANIFPAVALDNDRAYGTQEVIIETPDHTKELYQLEEAQIEKVLRMYARRTEALSKNEKIDYILCFKNQGSKAGASIIHPHSQIFATHILPPDIHEELGMAQTYRVEKKTCPYCDIIAREMRGARKIIEDDNVAALAPYASEFHYEAWIFTKRHIDNITNMNAAEFKSLAKVLKKILTKLDEIDLSYNYFLHQVVSSRDQHFYLKIQPRDSIWAGVELGSGLVINSVPPEEAAAFYRS